MIAPNIKIEATNNSRPSIQNPKNPRIIEAKTMRIKILVALFMPCPLSSFRGVSLRQRTFPKMIQPMAIPNIRMKNCVPVSQGISKNKTPHELPCVGTGYEALTKTLNKTIRP